MKIIGLDLAMTETGLCLPDGSTRVLRPQGQGDARLLSIRDRLRIWLNSTQADLAVLEDMTSLLQAHAAKAIGFVHGTVRTELLDRGIPYAVVSPATLKKYATGKGNCDKAAMILAAYKRGRIEFNNHNECDAWWLWAAGMHRYAESVVNVPALQCAALDTVTWPTPVATG